MICIEINCQSHRCERNEINDLKPQRTNIRRQDSRSLYSSKNNSLLVQNIDREINVSQDLDRHIIYISCGYDYMSLNTYIHTIYKNNVEPGILSTDLKRIFCHCIRSNIFLRCMNA